MHDVVYLKCCSKWAENESDICPVLEDSRRQINDKCEHCGSEVPLGRLNTRHYVMVNCKQVAEQQLHRNTLQRCFDTSRVSFHINTKALPPLEAFPYLGRTIAYKNSNWTEVHQNLRKLRRWWGMIARALAKTGATVRSRGMMYKAVAHSVLLYVGESWVVVGVMLKFLQG